MPSTRLRRIRSLTAALQRRALDALGLHEHLPEARAVGVDLAHVQDAGAAGQLDEAPGLEAGDQEGAVRLLHLADELLQRHAEQRQLFRIGLDPDLLRVAAGNV